MGLGVSILSLGRY